MREIPLHGNCQIFVANSLWEQMGIVDTKQDVNVAFIFPVLYQISVASQFQLVAACLAHCWTRKI